MNNKRLVGSTTDIAFIVNDVVVVHEGTTPKKELLGYCGFDFDDVVKEITRLYDEPKEFELRENFLKKYEEYINAEQAD